jgi:prolyl oligopeptidase
MYRKDAAGKEEIFLDPNTFLKTEQLLGGIDFQRRFKSSMPFLRVGSDWRKVIMDALKKVVKTH